MLAAVAVGAGPLDVLFDEDVPGRAQQCGQVRERADYVGAALDLLFRRSNGFVDQSCRQCEVGNPVNPSRSSRAASSISAIVGCDRVSIRTTSSNWPVVDVEHVRQWWSSTHIDEMLGAAETTSHRSERARIHARALRPRR